jgi:Family of unknown function (DUF5313)
VRPVRAAGGPAGFPDGANVEGKHGGRQAVRTARTVKTSRVGRLPGDPSWSRKILFALGARLPERYQEWVRHELTDAGWRGRLILRHLLLMLPICAALALLPGAVWIRIAVPGLFLICSVGIVAMYADDIRVSRLRRNGLQPPDDPDLGRPSH